MWLMLYSFIVDWELIVVTLGILLSFLFSASETALTSLGRFELQSFIVRGGSTARLVQGWIRDPSKLLTIVLVGNNISNTVGASIFALWAAKSFPEQTSLAIGAYTLILIVGAEIVPKLAARYVSVKIAPLALRFLNFVGIVIYPVIFIFQKISRGIILLSGMPGRESLKPVSEEDVTQTIEMATKEGGLDRETGNVLSNLMDFPDRIARDIMTPRSRTQAVSVKWTQDEVLRFIAQDGHSRYPVVRGNLDELVGVLLVKDLLIYVQRAQPGSWTRAVRRPYFISEVAPLGTVLRDMKKWGTHLAMVRNENGLLTGLLTFEDLIEEIVGEIRDEHDDPVDSGNEAAMGGPRLVSGEIPLLDFNDRYHASLPMDGSFSTLNGYLLSKTGGELPPVGTLIFTDDLTFRVHSMSDTGIVTLEIIETTKGAD